ncbi:hypothetical protein ACFVIY_35705 [Streptomyces sp. NPDC127166]|uniref:hypothetical protein n=1 Tax=Streptomyces sp. NPDC127166 TaxID=3345380 RepID=UPI00363E854B
MAHIRSTLVVATALVAGVVPVAVAAAAAPAAAVTARAGATRAAEMGTAVQEGGPLVVRLGEGAPVTTRFTVTLPASVTGRLTAGLVLGDLPGPLAGGDGLPGAECSVNGDAYRLCGWDYDTPEYPDSYGDGYVLSLPPTEAARTLTFDVRIDPTDPAPMGEHSGILEMKDASGKVVATGAAAVNFVLGTPEAYRRTTVHARDKAGVLWQYESTADPARPFKPRTRVGGGWDVYTAITKIGTTNAAGEGDLVARDKDGVLWYYEGSGDLARPFKPRVRVGGGWNVYTSISSGGRGLIARDRDGVLWHYADDYWHTNGPFKPRVRVGGGWNTYNLISAIGYEVVARDGAGVLWSYASKGPNEWSESAPFKPRVRVGGGWNTYDTVRRTGDIDGWSDGDGIARDKAGHLWLYKDAPTAARRQIGHGWDIYDVIL